MHFCTECGTPLPDSNTICPQCRKKAAAPEVKPAKPAPDNHPPTPPETARIHSGCTTSMTRGTRPIRRKKMATPGELHHLHNHYEEILDGRKAGTGRSM